MSLRTKLVLALSLLSAFAAITIGDLQLSGDRASAPVGDRQLARPDRPRAVHPAEPRFRTARQRVRPVGLLPPTVRLPARVRRPVRSGHRLERSGRDHRRRASSRSTTTIGSSPRPNARGAYLRRDVTISNEPYRMLTTSLGEGVGALQAARNVTEQQRLLNSLLLRIAIATAVVALAGALLGWLIARQVTKRLVRLTGAAEEVASTGRLDVAVPVGGHDEAGRLGRGVQRDARRPGDVEAGPAATRCRTPVTSCAPRSPACAPTSTCCGATSSTRRPASRCCPTWRARRRSSPGSSTRWSSWPPSAAPTRSSRRSASAPSPIGSRRGRVRRTGRQVIVTSDESLVVGPTTVDRAGDQQPGRQRREVRRRRDRSDRGDRRARARHGAPTGAPGLDPADVTHLFDRFYRATSALVRGPDRASGWRS